MFFILGLTWTFDIIAFALQPYERSHIGIDILVIFFLVVNSCHGVIFFCIIFFNSDNVTKMQTTSANFRRRISRLTLTSSTTNATRSTNIELEPLSRPIDDTVYRQYDTNRIGTYHK